MALSGKLTAGGKSLLLFDRRPIELDGFQLTARTARAVGRPTIKQWAAAWAFAEATEESSPFWVGDLWNYAKRREDWPHKLEQYVRERGLSMQRIYNLGSVSERVQGRARDLAPSLAHAEEVACLAPDEQIEWLDHAATEGWSKRELRLNISSAKRRKVVEGQAVLSGVYRVIYADPPWSCDDQGPVTTGTYKRVEMEC